MGKIKHNKRSKLKGGVNLPLYKQIEQDRSVKPTNRKKIRNRQADHEEYLDERLSRKILQSAQEQNADLEEEFGIKDPQERRAPILLGSRHDDSDIDDDEMHEYEYNSKPVEINEDEEKALSAFMSSNPQQRETLADIIMAKITEKRTEIDTQGSDVTEVQIDERVQAMFKGIGEVMSKYRSGKIPKALKVLPKHRNWEQLLHLTQPENWTPAALYQATRIFISGLHANMAQRFCYLVLLPHMRDAIAEYKRLNFHLYSALTKSLYKPPAFFKGIVLPLCRAGDCTLREAVIFASVIERCSIPMLHSAAALLSLAQMEYSGANSIFIRALLDKKYALAYRVVDALVEHFLRFESDERVLPVLWHQSLLTFAQRYKPDLTLDQRDALLKLVTKQNHYKISPEIVIELQAAKGRQ